jgi:hypothetical protein
MELRCIKDDGYDPVHLLLYLKNIPVKGEIYTLRGRVHTPRGLGYLLHEIENPLMPNGVEPNFHNSRFEPVGDGSLLNETRSAELAEA